MIDALKMLLSVSTICFGVYVALYGVIESFDLEPVSHLRKKQFKRKVLKSGYHSITELIEEMVTHTTAKDWTLENHRIFCDVFQNTRLEFCGRSWSEVKIYEKDELVFYLSYMEEISDTYYGIDWISNNYIRQADEPWVKEMLALLNELYKQVETSTFTKVEKVQLPKHSFEKDFKELYETIQALLGKCQHNEKWLSIESLHHISETFPSDVQNLKVLYEEIEEKDASHGDMQEALGLIVEKLKVIQNEAEENKRKMLQKQKLVIEKR